MAWRAFVTGTSRDSSGSLSIDIAFRENGVDQHTRTFSFPRGVTMLTVRAEIRSYAAREAVLQAQDNALEANFPAGTEIAI